MAVEPWKSPFGHVETAHTRVEIAGSHLSASESDRLQHEVALLLVELARLIMPAGEAEIPPVTIHLFEHKDGPDADASVHRSAPVPGEIEPLNVPVVMQRVCIESVALPLTQRLVSSWYGEDAAAAGYFLEGIAGLAVVQLPGAAGLDLCNRWVQAELASGRTVVTVSSANRASPPGSPPHGHSSKQSDDGTEVAIEGVNAAAASFVSFLCTSSDPDSLRRYLAGYDASRQDIAAQSAYNRPLALLEDEWLARMRRPASSRDSFLPFLRQIIPLLKPYRWKQLEILVYLMLAAAYNIVQPYAIKIFIDRVSHELKGSPPSVTGAGAAFVHNLVPFLVVLTAIYVANGLVSLRRAYTVNWLNQNVLNSLQLRMYERLQKLSHSYYINAKIGDLMARMGDDLDNVQSALSQITNKALYQSFTVIGALAALFILTRKSAEVAVPIVCIIPLFAFSYFALRTRNKQASRDQRKGVSQTMTAVHQDLQAHALIKAFGMERQMLSDYRRRVMSLQKSKLRLALLSAMTDVSEDMTTALAQLVVFGVGGYLVLRDHGTRMGVGDLSALLVLVKSIFSPIASLSGIGQTIQQATGSIERVTELLHEPIAIADKPDAIELPPLAQEIRFENVSFSYERPALQGLSLSIPAHSSVAIVGPSGSGKSTIVNLLLRFWDVDDGKVLFDGHDLRDVTLESLRSQIGLVFQETFILDTTLRANIALGRPDATDAEIAAAAKAAQLDRFIEGLPAGYDTIPGENGARLSVGQKQRIAIARVFLRNPAVLILDEATSALDACKEAGILETLAELSKGRTTISVTHRIAQAVTADRIFVISEGRLVEEGTHTELLASHGQYSELYHQSLGSSPHPDTEERPQSEEQEMPLLVGAGSS